MKNIYKIKDKIGGYIEVQILDHNNKVPEDLIWLHLKRKNEDKRKKPYTETGICIKPDEAQYIIQGLFEAINYIIDEYQLEKFNTKNYEKRNN